MSYRAYTYLTDLILVLQNLDMYFIFYTCLTERILILRILYWYYRTYICVQDLFLSYRSYTCVTELILVFRILFFCEGTRRYDESEQIRIISHTGSDQAYTDTYQVWTLVHNRYRSEQMHILILRIQEYP